MGPDPPLGELLDWTPAPRPARTALRGSHVLLRPVDACADAEPLYAVSHPPAGDLSTWTYLPDGPYESPEQLRRMLTWAESTADALYFTLVRLPDERPQGSASYQRITPEFGVIEIGHIWFGAPLRRTSAASEAIYLLARHAFDDLGYRRLEWKCDALNAASRGAAERFGFRFEGVFRNHMVIKGRNRDTAWYAITDQELARSPQRLPGLAVAREPRRQRNAAALTERADRRGPALTMLDRARIEAFLRSRGADRLAHPGGTLYAHMRRVGALLSDWGAEPVVQAAGLCHACYGTDGFAHSLLELSERAALVELIDPHAEQLVYLYGSCDRAAVYPQLANRGQVPFRDRFTGTTHSPAEQDVRAFVELTAANELDVLLRNPAAAAAHGEDLLRLLRSARHRLSDAAWQSWRASLCPAPDTVAELEK